MANGNFVNGDAYSPTNKRRGSINTNKTDQKRRSSFFASVAAYSSRSPRKDSLDQTKNKPDSTLKDLIGNRKNQRQNELSTLKEEKSEVDTIRLNDNKGGMQVINIIKVASIPQIALDSETTTNRRQSIDMKRVTSLERKDSNDEGNLAKQILRRNVIKKGLSVDTNVALVNLFLDFINKRWKQFKKINKTICR